MDRRSAGILLSVTALPSRHGIGDFGDNAKKFIDSLDAMGFRVWQILPLNPLGYGNSPYQPYSSFAIDEQFVSLDALTKDGLLDEVPDFMPNAPSVQYMAVKAFKGEYLKQAFEKYLSLHGEKEIQKFAKGHPWVSDWAVFMTFKKKYPCSWNEWPKEAQDWIKTRPALDEETKRACLYEQWLQMILYRQWDEVHAYAKKKDIKIIGDIPFYVGFDSCDVWTSQDTFLLDPESHNPTVVAGVPPDYFSEVGQRWGNPIYNWAKLKDNGFDFVLNRIHLNSVLYDILRLDHFRAFDTYWEIPASCPTAVDGEWKEPPGYEFFDLLFSKYPDLDIIAEDLGDLRPEVLVLRDHYHFPGMNVIQFTFHDYELLHKGDWDEENSVAYLDTHDNDTMLSYFYLLPEEEQGAWIHRLGELGISEGSVVDRMMTYCLRKSAKLAVLSMQDILNLDVQARTNVPGTVNDRNWTWKMASFDEFLARADFLKGLIEESGR